VIRCRAVLRSRHAQHGDGEIDLILAQRDQLFDAQTVAIRDENHCRNRNR
jgi:hypothetical protein